MLWQHPDTFQWVRVAADLFTPLAPGEETAELGFSKANYDLVKKQTEKQGVSHSVGWVHPVFS